MVLESTSILRCYSHTPALQQNRTHLSKHYVLLTMLQNPRQVNGIPVLDFLVQTLYTAKERHAHEQRELLSLCTKGTHQTGEKLSTRPESVLRAPATQANWFPSWPQSF